MVLKVYDEEKHGDRTFYQVKYLRINANVAIWGSVEYDQRDLDKYYKLYEIREYSLEQISYFNHRGILGVFGNTT